MFFFYKHECRISLYARNSRFRKRLISEDVLVVCRGCTVICGPKSTSVLEHYSVPYRCHSTICLTFWQLFFQLSTGQSTCKKWGWRSVSQLHVSHFCWPVDTVAIRKFSEICPKNEEETVKTLCIDTAYGIVSFDVRKLCLGSARLAKSNEICQSTVKCKIIVVYLF